MNTATAENPVYIYLAYDTANNFVAEEVKADGSNWKIKYEGVADNASVSDLNENEIIKKNHVPGLRVGK